MAAHPRAAVLVAIGAGCVRYIAPSMRGRLVTALSAIATALAGLLALAPMAIAADGVGLYGRTDDKVITFFAFGAIAFFALFVISLSLLQIRGENRKERRKHDLERLGS
jgi:hypothetical protein